MTNPSPNPKALLRKQFRDALNAMAEHQRLVGSRQICTLLRESDFWQQSQAVLAFAPLPTEPDIRPLWSDALAHGKILCLPRFDSATDAYAAAQVLDPDHDLISGRFGIAEPGRTCAALPFNRLDLVLVPGLGFGPGGRRLGRGRGYYDRLLTGSNALKCGLGFDLQWSESIPQEPCDVLLDCILTPGRGLVWSPTRS